MYVSCCFMYHVRGSLGIFTSKSCHIYSTCTCTEFSVELTPVNNAPFVREFPARSRPHSLARVSCSRPPALIPAQRLPAPLQRGRCLVIETTLISLHHFSVMFLMMPLSLALSIEN